MRHNETTPRRCAGGPLPRTLSEPQAASLSVKRTA